MKLINLLYCIVALSLISTQSQAQFLSTYTKIDNLTHLTDLNTRFNDMFWRNLPSSHIKYTSMRFENSEVLSIIFKKNNRFSHFNTITNSNNFSSNTSFTNYKNLNQLNSLTHFRASIHNIDKEVKQHQPKKILEYYENLINIYPNPLYSQSIIKFKIPKSGFGKLSVFDLSGKEIYNIAIGYFDKGSFEERLTRKHLSKGIYLVTLSVDNYTETKKLVVAR